MKTIISIKKTLTLLLLSVLSVCFSPVMARSDLQIMADVQKARVNLRNKNGGHSQHDMKPVKDSEKFRGVYYGYLPCKDCAGIKMTLSLKNKQNYLLVTQHAQTYNREYYEKGKYTWDTKTGLVTLTARKSDKIRKFRIKDDTRLIHLTPEGKLMAKGNQEPYTLVRGDKNNARSVHIH